MQKLDRVPSFNYVVKEYNCDKCGRKAESNDIIEYQEFKTIFIDGGYGSVFGDGAEIECDLCQHCLKELLGKYMHEKFTNKVQTDD